MSVTLVVAVLGVLLGAVSNVLHLVGVKSPKAEKVAEALDKVAPVVEAAADAAPKAVK